MIQRIKHPSIFFPACLVIAAMLLTADATAQIGDNFPSLFTRPLNVPQEFVITPFGYFHTSCVRLLAEGNTLLSDGRVAHRNGTIAPASVCGYPHYTRAGQLIPTDPARLKEINPLDIQGWLESVSATTTASYGAITATWTVPPAPLSNDGQLLYFFPGFEDINNVLSIVQPVMQWGVGYAGGGAYWLVSSWNCCMNGTTWYSPLLKVKVGDKIQGTVLPACKPMRADCPTWNVISADLTTGNKTTLAQTPDAGQVWNWAFGAVSEDYGVLQCSDFPNNRGLTFTVKLYDQTGKVIANPPWQPTQWISNPIPKCGYGTKITPTQESVGY